MLNSYSITPLFEDRFEERCDDIAELVKKGICDMPLFSMTLVPEGEPVWDKAKKMLKIYRRYRKALEMRNIDSGILVQASLGHGYPLVKSAFQLHIGLSDGKECYSYCPEDEKFIKHFCDVFKSLAQEHPKIIMIDDDFRIMLKHGGGCACPKHMSEFNKRSGLNITREELYEHIMTHNENDRLTELFREIQRDSLVKAITAFRKAVDSVDETIRGIICASGQMCEAAELTSKIWAGKGNPSTVRIPNGIYAPFATRGFSDMMRNSAICVSKLKKHGVEVLLSETDTIPFNRYAKSARYLHAQYTSAILEGLKGAKHWISRMSAFERDSGMAYRKILSKNKGMYESLSKIADEIKWVGINSIFAEPKKFLFHNKMVGCLFKSEWISKHIERMGLPFYYGEKNEGLAIIEEGAAEFMTDAQIENIFQKSVVTDGKAAMELAERGFGKYLGVEAIPCSKKGSLKETFDGTTNVTCQIQKEFKELKILNKNVKILSNNCVVHNETAEIFSAAVTLFEREDGNITVVFCGSPDVKFEYGEGFSFLNETRKNQFISIMQKAEVLPVYCLGDDELCLRAGYLNDGSLLITIYNLGIDPAENLTLFLKKKPFDISRMNCNGEFEKVAFEKNKDDFYLIKTSAETMMPVVLIIR